METPVQKFECWCLLELFGHQQMAGHVTEQTFGPASFFRVEVPATSEAPAFTRLLNPSAIYAINPVTEEVAKAKAEQIRFKPINSFDIRQMLKPVDETRQRQIESSFGDYDEDDKVADDEPF